MKCRLRRWKRPVGLTSQCRIILCSIFCCAFPGLITQSSSDRIWQEYSSFLTGILSQVLLVSLFSHLHSIMLLSRISSLYPCRWLLVDFILFFFFPPSPPQSKSVPCSCLQCSSLPGWLLYHPCVSLRVRFLPWAGNVSGSTRYCTWVSCDLSAPVITLVHFLEAVYTVGLQRQFLMLVKQRWQLMA